MSESPVHHRDEAVKATRQHTNTSTSTFLKLPPEIRAIIYGHVFQNESVTLFTETKDHNPSPKLTPLLNVVLVCQTCHTEAKPIFYAKTIFHLTLGGSFSPEGPSCPQVRKYFGVNAKNAGHICYHGPDPKLVFQIQDVFPNLRHFEMSLGEDFFHSDQTNFDRAMRYALRYGEWKYAIKTALDEHFGPGMRDAVARLRHLGLKRGFKVTLHWDMAYRFVDFRGDIDLDEWILRICDPDGNSKKVYEIPQHPLEPTWCEGRLTLPGI